MPPHTSNADLSPLGDGPKIGGYICFRCDTFIPNGVTHTCAGPAPALPGATVTAHPTAEERQAAALERIAAALERIAAKED